MAVPKKRTGHSAQGHRRSNWKATKPETTKCTNCGELVLTHTVCTACGYYKGKAVSIKAPNYVESTLEPKKPAKKAEAKPKAKKAEVKVEEAKTEEVKVEETKVEETTSESVEEVKTEAETEEKTEE